ncbi:MAG: hypothetical protein GY792_16475 [Gammaproteobacteria bacterium]|nr:hypothetical protein [Gammaproteobacteria bacterium]
MSPTLLAHDLSFGCFVDDESVARARDKPVYNDILEFHTDGMVGFIAMSNLWKATGE